MTITPRYDACFESKYWEIILLAAYLTSWHSCPPISQHCFRQLFPGVQKMEVSLQMLTLSECCSQSKAKLTCTALCVLKLILVNWVVIALTAGTEGSKGDYIEGWIPSIKLWKKTQNHQWGNHGTSSEISFNYLVLQLLPKPRFCDKKSTKDLKQVHPFLW